MCGIAGAYQRVDGEATTDRASMATSTEVRVPFVDPALSRAAFSLAGKDNVSGRNRKVALKRAAEAWLPKEIVYPFSAPLRAWVTRDLRDVIDDSLLGGELVGTGFFQCPALTDGSRPQFRARGSVQADLATAHPRVPVPPSSPCRGRVVTRDHTKESADQ
jgi:Asparagine synthase